jgi:protein ImuB
MCVWLPHVAIELNREQWSGPVAITQDSGHRRRLLCCNSQARAAGLTAGQDVPTALMRAPELRLIERTPRKERQALRAVADWSHQFTSEVVVDPRRWMLWLEVGASLRYFNGLSTLFNHAREGLTQLGYTASFGVAPTLEGAAVLAQDGAPPPALDRAGLYAVLADKPITRLAFDPKVIDQLHTAGLRTIGEVLQLPADALARRFDQPVPEYLQRLVGDQADVRRRHRTVPRFHRHVEFVEPVNTVEGLLFPLRRLLQEFEGYLRGRDQAVQEFLLELHQQSGSYAVLQLTTSAPQREARQLFSLLREKLEHTAVDEAVTKIRLRADTFVAPEVSQGDLFDDRDRLQRDWSALLDKLRARLGIDAVRKLGLADDHRPERAWCLVFESPIDPVPPPESDRPVWLLDPTPITQLPDLIGAPERIEDGWWSGDDSSRDYYLARTAQGALWWLFRDAHTKQWYLHGLWA